MLFRSAEDLAWSTEVWTSRSSLAFEAFLCGVPTYISTGHFPRVNPSDFLAELESVRIVEDFSKCMSLPTGTASSGGILEGASALELCLGDRAPS